MGTRSITRVKNEKGAIVVEIYKQYDGYPKGLGGELVAFCKSGKMTNGIPAGSTEKLFNGMGCFSAQLIAHLKKGVGEIYLEAPSPKNKSPKYFADKYYAEYVYEIGKDLKVHCWDAHDEKEVDLYDDEKMTF